MNVHYAGVEGRVDQRFDVEMQRAAQGGVRSLPAGTAAALPCRNLPC